MKDFPDLPPKLAKALSRRFTQTFVPKQLLNAPYDDWADFFRGDAWVVTVERKNGVYFGFVKKGKK